MDYGLKKFNFLRKCSFPNLSLNTIFILVDKKLKILYINIVYDIFYNDNKH